MMRCGMWKKSFLLICCLLLDTRKSVCVAARCSVEWLDLAECVSGPLRGLHADLRAQSEGSYLRQSEWDGPRRLDITRPSRILIMGGRCGMKVEGRRGSQNQTPWVPLQLLLRDTHRYVPAHTHTTTSIHNPFALTCSCTHRITAHFDTLILSRNCNSVGACSPAA